MQTNIVISLDSAEKQKKKKEEMQEKLPKTNKVINSVFSLFLFSRFHVHFGLN